MPLVIGGPPISTIAVRSPRQRFAVRCSRRARYDSTLTPPHARAGEFGWVRRARHDVATMGATAQHVTDANRDPHGVRTFYRLVETSPPTLRDFTSKAALGSRPPRDDPETVRLWSGLSVYSTAAQVKRTARRRPRLGGFVATLALPMDGSVAWERTLGSDGHHTVWGEPASLLDCVRSIDPL